MFSFWLTVLHTGPPRSGAALTELSPGCHRWFCTKSAASVYDSLGEGWAGWRELMLCRDAPVVSMQRPAHQLQTADTHPQLPGSWLFRLAIEITGQQGTRWCRKTGFQNYHSLCNSWCQKVTCYMLQSNMLQGNMLQYVLWF